MGKFLEINGVPTKIESEWIRNATLGLGELIGEEKSVEFVAKILRRKLKKLF